MRLVSGRNSVLLAKKISDEINNPIVNLDIEVFKNGEITCRVNEDIRGRDIFLIQSLSRDISNSIIETLIIIDALKRSEIRSINLIIPYLAYSRHDRQFLDNSSVSGEVVVNLFANAGIESLITVDMHSANIKTPTKINFINLTTSDLFQKDIKRLKLQNFTFVSPDLGRVQAVKDLSNKIGANFAFIEKSRDSSGNVVNSRIIGDIFKKDCIIVDDIVDSGQTLCNTIQLLKDSGSKDIYAYISHFICTSETSEKIMNKGLKSLVVTDSIEDVKIKMTNCVRSVTISGLIAKAIEEIQDKKSLSIAC